MATSDSAQVVDLAPAVLLVKEVTAKEEPAVMAIFDYALVANPAPAVLLVEEVMEEEEHAKARKFRKATAPTERKSKTVKVPKEKAVKVSKEKAMKVSKEKVSKEKAHASHPSYLVMVVEAIDLLKEQTSSSQQAIAKYLEDQYKMSLPPNIKKALTIQLRKLTKSKKLVKMKYSYKLLDKLKKPEKAAKVPSTLKATIVIVEPKARVVKKLFPTNQMKSKNTGAVGTKSKVGGAIATKADAKTSKVAKLKAMGKASAPAAKKAKVAASLAKKVTPIAKKEKVVAPKKIAPKTTVKKPVVGRKSPTVRKMVKSPKSVKANVTQPVANATPAQPAAK